MSYDPRVIPTTLTVENVLDSALTLAGIVKVPPKTALTIEFNRYADISRERLFAATIASIKGKVLICKTEGFAIPEAIGPIVHRITRETLSTATEVVKATAANAARGAVPPAPVTPASEPPPAKVETASKLPLPPEAKHEGEYSAPAPAVVDVPPPAPAPAVPSAGSPNSIGDL
jgi:hypothetical protein